MTRNHTIDTLRTIATIFVIFIHVSSGYVLTGKNTLTFDTSFWIGNVIDSFSRIGVPLFVLISGMFLLGRNETFKQTYHKRASRIIIPLIFWTIIYSFFKVLVANIAGKPIDFQMLLTDVIMGKPFYHLWFLFMLIGLYLATPIINNSIPKLSRKSLWALAILLLIFGMFNSGYDRIMDNNVSFMIWFMNYLGYFILGYLIKDSKRNFSPYALFSLYMISSVLIAVLTVITIKTFDNLYFYDYLTPLVILGALCFFKFFNQLNLKENILSKIAHLTLGIYLIHAGVLSLLGYSLKVLEITMFNNAAIGIPMKFVVTLSISIIGAWIISKIKYVRRLI